MIGQSTNGLLRYLQNLAAVRFCMIGRLSNGWQMQEDQSRVIGAHEERCLHVQYASGGVSDPRLIVKIPGYVPKCSA